MEEKFKNLNKPVTGFLKMLTEESCDIFKVNYWNALENQLKKSNLDSSILIKYVFEEILSKNKEIFKSKNLIFTITVFLKQLGNEKAFLIHMFSLLNTFIQNYEENSNIFRSYLGELSINLIFEYISKLNDPETLPYVHGYMRSFIDFDMEWVFICLKNSLEFDSENSQLFLALIENGRDIIESVLENSNELQLDYFIGLLNVKVNENNHNVSSINYALIELLTDLLTNKDKEISDNNTIVTLCFKLLNYIHKLGVIHGDHKYFNKIEEFLMLLLEVIINQNKLFLNRVPVFNKFFVLGHFSKFNKIFLMFLLYHCEEVYDSHSIKLCKNVLEESLNNLNADTYHACLSYTVSRLFAKIIATMHGGKSIGLNHDILKKKITVVNDYNNDAIKPEGPLHLNNLSIANLNLIKYLIESSIKENPETFTVYNKNLKTNIQILLSLNLDQYDITFQNYLIKFLLQFIYVIYQDSPVDIDSEICELILQQTLKLSNQVFIKTEMFPLVVTFLQNVIFTNLDKLKDKSHILEPFFAFFLHFSRNDAFVNLISKLLTALFNFKAAPELRHFALDKYTQLVLKANSGKVFTSYFAFLQESFKQIENQELISDVYVTLYNYCAKYEGSLHTSLVEFLFSKFESHFDSLPNTSFEGLFIFSCVYEILRKDQPESIINKLIQNFLDKKILKILDKLIKLNQNICEQTPLAYNLEHIIKSKQHSQQEYLIIANLIVISKIFADFISNLVINNKQFFDVKSVSEKNNKILTTIFETFDFITSLIFDEKSWNMSLILFINEFFAKHENLNFYITTHSYFMAIEHIDQSTNMDLSMLNDINVKIINDKNAKFNRLIYSNQNRMSFLKKLFLGLISYEINILQLIESKNRKPIFKNFVIDQLYDNMANSAALTFTKIYSGKLENGKQESFFIKEFLKTLYENCDDMKANSQLFEFMLRENILLTYFKLLHEYINFDLFFINYYCIIRSKRDDKHLLKSFLQFLAYFSKVNVNVFQATLRLFLNKNIFEKVIFDQSVMNEIFILQDFLLTQLIYYNSYKNETINYIEILLRNINTIVEKNVSHNLKYFGKVLKSLYEILLTQNYDESSHSKIEINKKFKDIMLAMLNNDWLYCYTNNVFNLENLKEDVNYFTYFENFDIVQTLKSLKCFNENDKRYQELVRENYLYSTIVLFSDVSFHRALNNLLTIFLSKRDGDERYKEIVENYILYHILVKNNKKLFYDLGKSLYLNQEFKAVNFQLKENFSSMFILTLLKDNNSQDCNCLFGRTKFLEAIGSVLHINIFRK
jgi:hypothetical protein